MVLKEKLEQWRIITPILLMILSGIMAFTGSIASTYLGQINSSIQEIGADLKTFTKEATQEINRLDTRVTVLERRVR